MTGQSFALEQRSLGSGYCRSLCRENLIAPLLTVIEAIDALADDCAGVVVDLAECEFIDSMGSQ